jgi:hypothetical protein
MIADVPYEWPAWLTRLFRSKPQEVQQQKAEILQPWAPTREFERAVFAALILAGEPVNNRRLAELMGVSPPVASRRVAQLEGQRCARDASLRSA